MADEYLDIFDENMEHLGTATRSEVHQNGYWHQSYHCWLIRRDGNDQYVLFQRRGPDKKLYPNMLDITAGGHLTAGEAPEQGVRELNEELGISTKFADLVPLGIRCDVVVVGTTTNREFCHTFLLESNLPLAAYKLQPDEVTGLVQMRISDGLGLFADEVEVILVSGYQVDENGMRNKIEIMVSRGDIIPRLDRYYMKTFIMTERYFEGIHYLGV